jgi:thiol-disulfide isomerase/thioredoxin
MSTTSTDTETSASSRNQAAMLPMLVLAGVVVAAFAALVVSLLNGDGPAATNFDTAKATITGNPLAAPGTGTDPAVGQEAPVLSGQDLGGHKVTAPADGKPTVVLFLAHWCPHCRREVPKIQDYVEAGGVPKGAELVAVSTAMNPSRPNFPPSEWLGREDWTSPVLADADDAGAEAYGLPAFPYWVAIDADRRVVVRATGELSDDQIDGLFAAAVAGAAEPAGTTRTAGTAGVEADK